MARCTQILVCIREYDSLRLRACLYRSRLDVPTCLFVREDDSSYGTDVLVHTGVHGSATRCMIQTCMNSWYSMDMSGRNAVTGSVVDVGIARTKIGGKFKV